jgi:predicted acetyltransferase
VTSSYLNAPIDPTSAERLAADKLRFTLIDESDAAVFAEWSQSVARGFHGPRDTPEQIAQRINYFGQRRASAVYDDSAADAASPVATIDVWSADLTVPGTRAVPAWAISGVTVGPTHRRRGIAAAMLEAELRTAASLGFPVAMLTVSESTIYGRWGFGVSAQARDLTIDTRRVSWRGEAPAGRVQFVTREQLQVDGHALVERVRLETPGQIEYSGVLWDRQLGLRVGDETAKSLRFIRFDAPDGTHEGFAIYKVNEDDTSFSNHTLEVLTLVSATDAAYEGLWRYILDMDLVTKVTAHLRPVDEPLRWMITDFRAMTTSDVDHLWTRVLDVKAALEGRSYEHAGRVVIEVVDRLGFAAGTWAVEVASTGSATVSAVDETPDATLDVRELGSLYLGGVSAATLQKAGLVTGDAAKVDAIFATTAAPWLSIWF